MCQCTKSRGGRRAANIARARELLAVPATPRFRALALFGRRLSERRDGLGMPASENLHMNRPSRGASA
jgi:hypothetical protein